MLPNDPKKRELISKYLQEAYSHENAKKLADSRLKGVFESVKESEDSLGYTLSEFKLLLKAALDEDKLAGEVELKTNALESLNLLRNGGDNE